MLLSVWEYRSATFVAATQQLQPNCTRDNKDGEREMLMPAPENSRPVERLVILRQDLPLASTACARRLLATGLVRLDVGGLELGDAGLDTIVAWTPWLRELSAAGSNIPSVHQSHFIAYNP